MQVFFCIGLYISLCLLSAVLCLPESEGIELLNELPSPLLPDPLLAGLQPFNSCLAAQATSTLYIRNLQQHDNFRKDLIFFIIDADNFHLPLILMGTGSVLPWPALPRLSPGLKPIFANIAKPYY